MKKIFSISLAIFVCLLFSSPISFAATPSISSEVGSIKSTVPSSTPSAPSGMDEKGYVGSLLEKLFNSNSKIYWGHIDFNGFLSALGLNSVGNNQVPKWNSTTNTFQNSNIYSNGGNIGIGRSNPNYNLDVNGNINFTGDLYQNGTLFSGGKFKDGTNARDAVYASTNVPGRNVGIGTDTPTALLDVRADAKINGLTVGRGGGNIVDNTSIGLNTLENNISGIRNVALGVSSLRNNTTGYSNTAIGTWANVSNTTGSYNTSVGFSTASYNTTGERNTAVGLDALNSNTDGSNNTAIGSQTLGIMGTGNNNTVLGYRAGYNLLSGDNNIAIGNTVAFENNTGSNQLNIGNWIYGQNGNIGIGTTTPTQRLDVSGNIQSSGRGIFNDGVQIDGNTVIDNNAGWHRSYGNTGWYNQTYGGGIYMSDATWIRTYGGKKFYVNNDIISTGDIGIGTASPTQKLDVVGNASANNIVARNNTQGIIISGANNQNSGPNIGLWGPSASSVAARNDITFRTNTTSRMIIDGSTGNVGINTLTPSQKLEVNGNIRTPNQVRANLYCDENGNNCFDPQYGRMKCTVVNWNQGLELTSAERPDGNRYMMQPSAIPYRCRQLGYDTGFVRGMFGPQGGVNGWCGYGNARTAYRDTEDNMWRGESCKNGEAVHSAFCCSY